MTDTAPSTSPSERSRATRLVFRVLLALVSVLIGLVLAELILFGIGFSYQLYPERVEFGYPDPAEMAVKFEPVPDLFWVPKKPIPYAYMLETARRAPPAVIFMGDSCTQFGTYPQILAATIKESRFGMGPSIANFGVGGWSTYQGLQQLKRDVLGLAPRIIVIYYGWNDHWIGFGIEDKDIAKMNNWWVYPLRKLRIGQLVSKIATTWAGKRREAYPNRVSPEDFAANLREMVRLAKAHDIVPVLVTAPSSHQRLENLQRVAFLEKRSLRRLEDLIPVHRQYVDVVRDVARTEDAVLCDLYEQFNTLPAERVVKDYFFGDGIHLHKAGNAMIAHFLFECFKKHDLIERTLIGRTSTR